MSLVARVLTVFRSIAIVIAIGIVFLFGVATTVYLSLRSPEVTVPDVVGKNRFDAEKVLADADLKFRVRATRPSNEAKPDTVMFQLPRAGEVVKAGQTVAMDISRATKAGESPETVTPDEDTNANRNANTNTNANENKPRRPRNRNTNDNANANGNNNGNNNRAVNGNANNTLSLIAGVRYTREQKDYTFQRLEVSGGGRSKSITDPTMAAPFSHEVYPLVGLKAGIAAQVSFTTINDYGGITPLVTMPLGQDR